MEEGLFIEYVGGPEDGRQSVLKIKGKKKVSSAYPLEIKIILQDMESKEEQLVGRYVRDHENASGVMRYLWSLDRQLPQKTDG